jgi:hypothetical protein
MTFRPLVLTLTLAVAALAAACGTESSRVPTAPPVSAPPPAPTPPDGTWTGTFASTNWPFSPFTITVRLARTGDSITGTWSDTAWLDFGGEIKGTLHDTLFDGTVSVNDCSGTFRGTITAAGGQLTSAGVTGCGPIFPGVPNPVDIKLLLSRWYAGP